MSTCTLLLCIRWLCRYHHTARCTSTISSMSNSRSAVHNELVRSASRPADKYASQVLHITYTRQCVSSALHPSGVAKSSTSFGWSKGGKVTSARWPVTLCDLIWHVISRSGVVISITNCYIRFTLLYFTLHATRRPAAVSRLVGPILNVLRQVTRGSRHSLLTPCDAENFTDLFLQ